MGDSFNLYGPPGSGKTRRLAEYAERVVREHGPTDLGALTFTRAAAAELRTRLAPIVGALPERAAKVFPYVGTIHSVAWQLSGRQKVITNAQRREWALSLGYDATFYDSEHPDYADALDFRESGERLPLVRQALQNYAAARQRCVDPFAEVDGDLIHSYEDYKRQNHVIDFEDMLEQGMRQLLPVRYMLVDEAQDNSALLWKVIDAWRRHIDITICAGDPWQAIYQFSGGDPLLFRSQPGKWDTIDDSHRLSAGAAEYAVRALREGGQEDPLFDTWKGIGGEGRDGSEFYLARTSRLVEQVADRLMLEGVPFAYLSSRKGPLGVEATSGWRAGQGVIEIGGGYADVIIRALQGTPRHVLPTAEVKRLENLAKSGNPYIRLSDLYWGSHLPEWIDAGPNADYYWRISRRYGAGKLVLPPTVRIGTIHAAKGREADTVHLATCWGLLPGRAALEGDVGEVCVAYVGLTRHRKELDLMEVDNPYGLDYLWPEYDVVNT